MSHIIELENIHKSYFTGEVEVKAVRGVSLNVAPGEFVAIMGASGSGKSTMMNVLGCLDRPTSGEVSLFGTRIDHMSEEAMLPLRRRAGFVFQSAALFDSLSAFENVAYPLREHTNLSLGEITDRVHRFLSLVGLPGVDDLFPAELSGGMKKRVGIARALVTEPEVVFFDEPTAGLDPTNARLVAELIAELRKGVCDTAIVVTHDIEFAEMVSDQMAILHQGRFAEVGTPAAVRASSNPDVRRFLAGELREN